jgi:hypothetical protein
MQKEGADTILFALHVKAMVLEWYDMADEAEMVVHVSDLESSCLQ